MHDINKLLKIAKMIAKNISNQISTVQKEELTTWVNESKRHEQLVERISDWENLQKRNQFFESINTELAWDRFLKSRKKLKFRIRLYSSLKYAAVLAIPLILGAMIFYQTTKQNGEQTSHVACVINPGTKNAIVVLDDGSAIELEKETSTNVVEKDGSVINSRNGELRYDNSKSKKNKKPLINKLKVPRGGEFNLVLSDSSRVYLNSVSTLTYPIVFNGKTREVTLEGEAYFEIHKNKNKPFIVHINGINVEVLGTSFNVKAFKDENKVFTTLVEGKIKLHQDKSSTELILSPNQQAILDKTNNKIVTHEVDVSQFIGWKNGVYYFSNQSLDDIMRTLSRWYDFEYEIENTSLKDIYFEGGLNKYDDINPILEIMESTGKVKIKTEGNKITFM